MLPDVLALTGRPTIAHEPVAGNPRGTFLDGGSHPIGVMD